MLRANAQHGRGQPMSALAARGGFNNTNVPSRLQHGLGAARVDGAKGLRKDGPRITHPGATEGQHGGTGWFLSS